MRFWTTLLVFAAMCSTLPRNEITNVNLDLQPATWNTWNAVIDDVYPDAIVVTAHGSDRWGTWCLKTDQGTIIPVTVVLEILRSEHPTKQIVLIVCNPGGYVIDMPNVTYALNNVWVMPDAWLGTDRAIARELRWSNLAGGLDEFQHNR